MFCSQLKNKIDAESWIVIFIINQGARLSRSIAISLSRVIDFLIAITPWLHDQNLTLLFFRLPLWSSPRSSSRLR